MRAFALLPAILLMAGVSFAAAAQDLPDANSLVTCEDYLRYAALNNASLKASFEQFKAATEQVPQAGSLPDPKFTYAYFIEEIETRVGPQKNRFSISQTFPWFGKIESGTDAASKAAKAAQKRYEAEKLKLFFRVKQGFYEYAYLAHAIEIAGQNVELLQNFEQIARTRYTTGTGTHPDIIRAQIELAILADKLESLRQMRKPMVAKLNSILNRPAEATLPWPKSNISETVEVDSEKIITELRSNNPELQAVDFELASARSNVQLAEKKSYPDFSIGVDWIQTDRARSSSVSDSGKDAVIAMFSINLPLWSDSYKAAQRQAMAQVRKVRAQKQQLENDMVAQALQAVYDFQDSGRKSKLYKDVLIPKTKEMLTASESAYKAGTIDFLSLVDAQQTLLLFEISHERAITDNLQKLAELEMLAGRPF